MGEQVPVEFVSGYATKECGCEQVLTGCPYCGGSYTESQSCVYCQGTMCLEIPCKCVPNAAQQAAHAGQAKQDGGGNSKRPSKRNRPSGGSCKGERSSKA